VPILIMIGLIPIIQNDYLLLLAYALIIAGALFAKYEDKDWLAFVVALVALPIFEYIFVSKGVEVFLRRSLFGIMPIWLPVLWGYAFVAIKRVVKRL